MESCSSPLGSGVVAVRNSLSSSLFDPHYANDPVGIRIDMKRLLSSIEGSARPQETSFGAGAALGLAVPWGVPSGCEGIDSFPGELKKEFIRGYVRTTGWLLGGDEASMSIQINSGIE